METKTPIATRQKPNPEKSARLRLRVLQIATVLFFAVVSLRLIQVQIVESARYRDAAQRQYQAKVVLPATRGTVLDRNGNIIAANTMFVSLAADPKLAANDARAIASRFSRLFGKSKGYYLDKLRSDSRFVWLERQVNNSYLKRIDTRELDGLVIRPEPKRLYFHDQIAGQLIGCTDIDNKGLAGIELLFDRALRGLDGYVIFQRDGLGHARPSVDYPRADPVRGHDITLTIDMNLQAIAEEELKKGIISSNAERGIVVMLQPKTGEILAVAQYPNVDPNNFGKFEPEDQKLRAITDMFEPGSVFKVVTASAALEYSIISPDRKFFAENGLYIVKVGGRERRIVDTHKEGWITFQEGMEFSSNIVMAKASDMIGSERLYKMARDYGFGIATNVEFPGEEKGILKKPVEWSGTTLNTIAFGYEIGATPLQIAAAYAAVANGGVLMKPYLFRVEVDAAGDTIRSGQPQMIRRVVSPATAGTLTQFFEGVVLRGTGKTAAIPGVRVAGKTGTSKKLVEGKYGQGSYTASFVGFFPAEDPQIVCLVMMEDPHGPNYTGGTTSAPVFHNIAERIINTSERFAPPVSPQSGPAMMAMAPANDDDNERPADTRRTVSEIPPRTGDARNVVPDVRGCSVRRAVGILRTDKFLPVVRGSGTVISQTPSAGQAATPGKKVILTCQPKSVVALGAP